MDSYSTLDTATGLEAFLGVFQSNVCVVVRPDDSVDVASNVDE